MPVARDAAFTQVMKCTEHQSMSEKEDFSSFQNAHHPRTLISVYDVRNGNVMAGYVLAIVFPLLIFRCTEKATVGWPFCPASCPAYSTPVGGFE